MGTNREPSAPDRFPFGCAPLLADGTQAELQAHVDWLASLYRGRQVLNALEPDRLGELLVATVLSAQPDGGHGILAGVLGLSGDGQVTRCLETMTTEAAIRWDPAFSCRGLPSQGVADSVADRASERLSRCLGIVPLRGDSAGGVNGEAQGFHGIDGTSTAKL